MEHSTWNLLFNQPNVSFISSTVLTVDYTNNDPPGGGGTLHAPEPGMLVLVGTGLIGLAGWSRKKFLK